ncbi:MAG TPA: ABC transporter ATP-binding protein [Oligoflexus sp.]|uniref:ABC transporter ATP-binding protein n=1 Tax=Oligoflexus sp. TaxID=1971216 RepID=UPI002D3B83E0|nr:ABC transporter ATP-binding protein [Oligoflexus sp.]HYX39175.1 ABC transporter ATP-binding protein [Oligoflexus sp.]
MVYRYLQRRLTSLVIATLCTFALGIVSALTFALIGPAWQVLTQPKNVEIIRMDQLFNERLGAFVSWVVQRDSFPAQELWTLLPYLIAGAATVRALLTLIQWFLWERSSELVAREMRQDLVENFLDLHPEARRDSASNIDVELAANIGTDIRMVREYLVHFFGGFPRELIQCLLYLVTLFLLEPRLAAFFLLGLGPAGLLLSRLGKKLRKRSQKVLSNVSQLSEWLQQRLSGLETIKQFRTESNEVVHMEQLSKSLFRTFVQAARVKARTSPLLQVVAVAAMMVVIGYGIKEIDRGDLNSSILMSFFSLLGILSQSASKLGRYFNSNKEGEAALHRLESTMKAMKQGASPTWQTRFAGDSADPLILNQLSYRYPGTTEQALSDLTLNFKRGRIYAIAGPSGSGKSTLLKLILGLWRAPGGALLYGVNGPEDIGYLPQTIQLMPASIAANITYPDKEVDEARLKQALQEVRMLEFVEQLPQGWHAEVGDGALTVSGGQAQRLQLARLFYHRFPLIIIDEGTSALDPETESLIFSVLKSMVRQGSTILMVAHRLSALKIADELIVLRRGRLHYQGPPQTVLQGEDWRELFDGEA